LPDLTFLTEHQKHIRGLLITHGHEDHIGGVPNLLKTVGIPQIYGPALALGLLEGKLKEYGLDGRTQLIKVHPRQEAVLGCFSAQFIRCTHSIADSYSLIIRSPVGTIVHTGDFKFDFTPVDGEQYDIASLAAASETDQGILLLLSDSTNVEREGYSPSERTVRRRLEEVFANAGGRIIVTTFASNVHRMKQVMEVAMKYDRKISILGRSMLNLAGLARELGYLSFPDGLLVRPEEVNSLAKNEVVILTTGSQGEPLSALTRIANGEHKQIQIIPGDTVVISATPIPGNERSVANTINALFGRGADVIYGREAGVHVSGHACREEQRLMLNICKPKYFMPVHGEYRMLVKHAQLASECGVDKNNSFVLENGELLEIKANSGQKLGAVKSGIILVDGSRAFDIDMSIVHERQLIAEDGLVVVTLSIDKKHQLAIGPEISLRALTIPADMSAEEITQSLKEEIVAQFGNAKPDKNKLNIDDLKDYLSGVVQSYFDSKLKSRPLVQVMLQEVSSATKSGKIDLKA
jgi:ribonuclease J